MKYANVIFDLDGTLLDTLDDLTDAVNYALNRHGWPSRTREEVRDFVGSGVRTLMRRACPDGEASPGFGETLDEFRTYYSEHSRVKTAPYPGILSLLGKLKTEGVGLAIVSNKFDGAVRDLNREFFGDLIPVAIGEAEEKGIRKKPAPDTVFEAMRRLGAKPENTVYIGDSEVDVKTAANAGLPCVAVTWGFRSEETLTEAGAAVFADDAEELFSLL